ncbi:Hpt domain-containing protein [Achromobacter ruhlandii]|uniref:Hpt domain-containing protein n=1 Tax=Achromobacter ruhlandii TaxID=72557 RepID=UPI0039E1EEEE
MPGSSSRWTCAHCTMRSAPPARASSAPSSPCPPQASLEREKSKEFYETQLRAAFNTTMREDMASMREALAARDPAAAVSTLHRMRGSLVVVNADETARFCGVLEQKIAAEGLTPVLENAVRSTLAQLTEKFKEL